MRKMVLVLLVLAMCGVVSSCDRELKPSKEGVWLAVGGKLTEMPAVILDKDFTPEGFMVTYYAGEPTATVTGGAYYFIFYGDYSSFSLRQFARRGSRWEEDTTRSADVAQALQVGQMAGEKTMRKAKINKELRAGTYVLDAQGPKGPVAFVFTVQ